MINNVTPVPIKISVGRELPASGTPGITGGVDVGVGFTCAISQEQSESV